VGDWPRCPGTYFSRPSYTYFRPGLIPRVRHSCIALVTAILGASSGGGGAFTGNQGFFHPFSGLFSRFPWRPATVVSLASFSRPCSCQFLPLSQSWFLLFTPLFSLRWRPPLKADSWAAPGRSILGLSSKRLLPSFTLQGTARDKKAEFPRDGCQLYFLLTHASARMDSLV